MPAFTSLIQYSTGSPSHRNQTIGRNKRHVIGKEEVKPSLFAHEMTLYIENLKESTKKVWELKKEFSKLAGCQNSYPEINCILYAYFKITEKEIKQSHMQLLQKE